MVSSEEFIGKRFVVTGASSGIGYGVTSTLLELGAFVIGIGRDASKFAPLQLKTANNKPDFISYDLSDIDGIKSLFDELQHKGKFDGIVLCAGREDTLPLSLCSPKVINEIFSINIFSNIEIVRQFSKKSISNDGASIVLISSVMAELGQPGKIGYCSSKAATLGLVKSAALELVKRQIRINAVSPGIVKTEMVERLFASLTEDNIDEIKKMHPSGIGNTSDVVPSILFLLSNGSKWITGQNMKIDGGYSIR